MLFEKEWLIESLYDDTNAVLEDIIDQSRWSTIFRRVFKYEGKFYETTFSRGSTECQDERPYEFEGDMIECKEVFPVEKTVIVYE
jgi:hypothetical protein